MPTWHLNPQTDVPMLLVSLLVPLSIVLQPTLRVPPCWFQHFSQAAICNSAPSAGYKWEGFAGIAWHQ
jgi:hypothetical protein